MVRSIPGRRPGRCIGGSRLILGGSAGLLAAILAAGSACADDRPRGSVGGARPTRLTRSSWPGGETSDGGWSMMACAALVLIAGGGAAVWVRRAGPRASAGDVRVVGRVSLSPRHSVYLLRVGRRVLVLGAGSQGPPSLIAELDDVPQDPPASPEGAES
jgi:hypothetical protein